MRLQKRIIDPMPSNIPERGFYTEAELSDIIRKAFQEVMLTLVDSDSDQEERSAASSWSNGKLTLSVQEAADLIGISKPKMFDLLHSGEISSKRVGKKIIISYQAVVDWINDE